MNKFSTFMLAFAGAIAAISLLGEECIGAPFHNGSNRDCQGCHTDPPSLKGADPGSTCLICHQAPAGIMLPKGHYVSTDPRTVHLCVQLPPGGDFCWLKKTYKWSAVDRMDMVRDQVSRGESHGHNIVALDFDYAPDSRLLTAPGGSYLSSALTCISCHDPHGNYRRLADGSIASAGPPVKASGSYADSPNPDAANSVGTYRMLAGKGYLPKHQAGGVPFTADPPAAVAPSSYNREETSSDTRVAYGSGMSEWCANCHAAIHNDDYPATGRHPSGNLARFSGDIINNYNAYLASGNLRNLRETAYSSLIPFELGTRDYALLKSVADASGRNRSGPLGGGGNVMCLTCHRAHASGWDDMMRWNMDTDFIVYKGVFPGIDNSSPLQMAQGRTEAETRKGYYDRQPASFSDFQRSLCNKCHAKD